MKEPNGFYTTAYRLGDWLMTFLKLQGLWFFFVLRGGILCGIFPATATLIRYFFDLFQNQTSTQKLYSWFKQEYRTNFRIANLLGIVQAAVLLFLWIELRISSYFVQNRWLHLGLLLLFVTALLVSFYLFPVFIRYNLSLGWYFRQASLLMISSIPQTIAMMLGIFLVTVLATFLPILLFVAFVPLLLFPISWFAFQAIQKAERLQQQK